METTTITEVYEIVYDFSELLEVSNLQLESINELILHLNNITAGLQILIYVAIAFLVWKVITVLGKLFGGWFLGGL